MAETTSPPSRRALRIAGIYVLFAVGWILFSDLVVVVLFEDAGARATAQTFKGWLFGLLSGGLIYALVRRDSMQTKSMQRQYQELFQANRDALMVVSPEGRFLDANPAAEQLYGYSLDQLKQMHSWDLVPPENRPGAEERLRILWQSGGGFREMLIYTASGQRIPVEASISTTNFYNKKAFMCSVRDVSERRQLLDQLEQHASELEERVSERTAALEAKSRELEQFAYSISHDLKAPLRGIDGYARLLENDYRQQLDAEGQLFIQNVRRGATQMSQLIDDLLAYSRLERRRLTPRQLYVRALIDTLLYESAEILQEQGITVQVDLPELYVFAEPESFYQALQNLLQNAIKFTAQKADPQIRIGGMTEASETIIWIADNGIGFDMQYHDRIFEIFQRLHRAEDYPGTGVGLALVRKACERMGGRVWATAEPGVGATFYIALPREGVDHDLVTTNSPGRG